MARFTIAIAGTPIGVSSLFDSARDYCARYLTEEAPAFSLAVSREDLEFEQAALLAEALEEGMKPRVFTDPFLDRAAIQRKAAEGLLERGVLLFHGSTVAVDGEAYLFTAECGTGKSTHTRLWRQVFGGRAAMVNDDKPFLKITDTGVLACGAPWSGKHGLDSNITVPLRGICVLSRGRENRIRPIRKDEAMGMLTKQALAPRDPGRMGEFLQLTDRLASLVPLWQMDCTKAPIAAQIAYTAMSGGAECTANV